jgi:lipopolysaccharide/colanic/teichoic acid biosynthesis glycosyltransferase
MLEIQINAQCEDDARGSEVFNSARNALPAWKRALDLACLIFAAPALLPIMGVIALAIRVSSPGPILFRQERIGLRGRSFMCFKFRTMTHAAETKSHETHLENLINSETPMKKLDGNDARVLRIGKLLRASGLDELPQIFNILRGEMSFVGPRPCVRYEYEKYRPEHRARFNAVPGITGLWQVSGKNKTTFRQMVALDIAYSRNLSLWQDVSILFRTFPVLLEQTSEVLKKKQNQPRPEVDLPRPRRASPRPLTSV